MEPGDEELQKLRDLINKPTPREANAAAFLKEHGVKLTNPAPSTREVQEFVHNKDIEELEGSVNQMLHEYRKKLFGDSIEQSAPKIESLENLAKAVEQKLCKAEENKPVLYLRDRTTLLHEYNVPDPHASTEDSYKPSTHFAGLHFLETALKRCQFGSIDSKTDSPIFQANKVEEEEKKPCTVRDVAKILAAADEEFRENREKICDSKEAEVSIAVPNASTEQGSELTVEQDAIDPPEAVCESSSTIGPSKQDVPKESKKKKKKKYEPKKVDISWSDPRTDPEFLKEISEMMLCDSFEAVPTLFQLPRELDDLSEDFDPPILPRNIVEMLKSVKKDDFADWEYSLKLEKGEYSESESEAEESKKDFDDIVKELDSTEEVVNENAEVHGPVDVSDFMKLIIPPVLEDIIAVRDDMGNIDSYESVRRRDEHLSKEYERVYLDLESESEDEENEDPVAEDGEINWAKDFLKGSDLAETDQSELTESKLRGDLKNIKLFLDSHLKDTQVKFDPALEEQMNKVDKLLDIMGVPKAGEIENGHPREVMKNELKKLEHIFQAHKDKICPPGNLEIEITSEDDDDVYYKNLSLKLKREVEDETVFERPATLQIKLNIGPDLSEEDIESSNAGPSNLSQDQLNTQLSQPFPSLFGKDNESKKIDEPKTKKIPNFFADTDSSDDEDTPLLPSENEERHLDKEFINEYFKRGGTEEGLKDSENEMDEGNLELEPLKSFAKKYFTFPFISKHIGKFDLVSARRFMAENFPELRDEAFADLSNAVFDLDLSEDSSSDSSQYTEKLIFTPNSFQFEDISKKPTTSCPSCFENESLPTADEDEEFEFEPMSLPNQTLEQLIKEKKSVKKRQKKRMKQRTKIEEQSSDSEEENETSAQTINLIWSPIVKFEKPSYENAVSSFEKVYDIFKPPCRFRRPRGMKAWLKGEYNPSKETLQQWKKTYYEQYGGTSILDKVITPDKQKKYQAFLERIDEPRILDDTEETNFILIFKRLVEEQKRERERKEKADEIISSSDFYQQQSGEIKEEKPVAQDSNESTSQEKCDVLVDKVDKISINNSTPVGESTLPLKNITEELEAEPPKTPVIRLREVKPLLKKEEWAEELNCTVKNELNVTPALTFSFQLDGFQREAIQALEDGYNVFVSAHTSAGKTVVAEYAIAMSKRNRSKAVYTSPVKALSNQKYADFKRIFGSVGLITGDIQLNENAECLIMTTEILRSMLYNSSEKIRDLEFVVFDEVHYINDPERGHVWEEVLILLPSQVQIVMLSATVPNTLEFANWVGRTKQRKVMVCATHQRPVPLNHYLYTGTGGPSPGNTYLVKCGDGSFNEDQYLKAQEVMKVLQETERRNKKKQQMKRNEEEKEWKRKGLPGKPPIPPGEDFQSKLFKKDQTMWIALINFLVKKDWLPAVCFVFSRKKCDAFAEMLYTVDLTTKSEKSFIHRFIKSQIEKLDDVDQDLPQIQIMKRQLDKGIGVHHSGILPVMKEIVEVLFQEGKVKLLFATETFAMGVNMPARTVVFHAVKKFDGNETRLLQPAEYVQMAGRAGRRGKDSAGNVIILMKPTEIVPRSDLETLLYGNPCKLISKFRLSYRMILNTLTVSGMLTVQNMMERSFCENHGQMKRKFFEKELVEAEKIEKSIKKHLGNAVDDMVIDILSKFYDLAISFVEEWNNVRLYMVSQSRIFKDLCPGRILKVSVGSLVQRTALLLDYEIFPDCPFRNSYKVMIMDQNSEFERIIAPDGHDMDQKELETWYRIVELMSDLPHEIGILCGPNDYTIHNVKIHNVVGIFKESLKLPRNLFEDFLRFLKTKSQFSRIKSCEAGDTIAMHLYGYTGKYTAIDETNISYDNFDISYRVMNMWSILEEIKKSPVSADSPLVMKAFRRVFRWKQALRKVQLLRHDLSAENMSLYPDFRSKMDLLQEKGYISNTEQVQMKGYMAARIGKYELIVCEMLVENVLLDLSPEEVAALLSFLVYQSNAEDPPLDKSLPAGLESAILKCKKIMAEVQSLEKKYDIRDFEGSEISKLKFGLIPVMYAWAKQEPLKNIMDMSVDFDFQEGLLVRWIQQLLETLKEVEAAARLMGDPGVPARLQAAGQSIKRGIVFAPSLYTTMI